MNTHPYPPSTPPQEPESLPPQQVRVSVAPLRPVVTYALVGITAAVFLLQYLSESIYHQDILLLLGAKIDSFILQGEYWRLITPVFLHASIPHILLNMYALLALGPGLERQYGHWRYLALYLVGGFAGNVISFFFSSDPLTASVGSSTAIFGLLAAQGVFIYQNRRLFGSRARQVLTNIVVIGVINLLFGLTPGSQIDNLGHIGGLLGGALFAWFAGPILRVEGLMPDLRLVDDRPSLTIQLSVVGVFALFAGIALLKILSL